MDFFKSLQERAQQAVATASELASKAGENALAALDVVAADARGIAGDTQLAYQRVQSVAQRRSSTAVDPHELASARISDELLDHVRTLTYASFRENEDASASESSCQVLQPWQVRHATLILKLCHELEDLRFVLSPKRMSEARFWQIYFFLANPYIDAAAANLVVTPSPSHPSPSTGSPRQNATGMASYKPSASWSNIDSCRDGWESEDWENQANESRGKLAATPDDLDEYLKDIMDGDNEGGMPAAGDDNGDDLDKYLDELDDNESTGEIVEDAVAAEKNGELLEDDDLSKYLDDLDVDESDEANSNR